MLTILKNKTFPNFVIIGALNTLITYLLYILLLLYTPYLFAYSISYLVGIVFSYFFNCKVVFKTQTSIKSFVFFPLVYVMQYIINIYVLQLLIEYCSINDKIAPIITTIVSIPLTFLISKFILTGRKH